jgi:hypothetical protein
MRDAFRQRQRGDGLVRRKAHERVERCLEPEEHADAACPDLAAHVEPARAGLIHAREDATPLIRRVIALHRGDRHRAARCDGHLLEQVELRIEAVGPRHHVEVADGLDDAMAEVAEGSCDADQLARVDLGGGRRGAARGAMVVGAPRREPRGAGLEGGAQQIAHLDDLLVGRDLVGDGAVAHDVHAERVVGDLQQEVDGVRHRRDGIHVVCK